MNRTLSISAMAVSAVAVVMSGLALRRSYAPVITPPPSARAAMDECDADYPWMLTTCLLPRSDHRADPRTQLKAGVDCYWERQATVKYLRWHASYGNAPFTLVVSNHCSNQVGVKLYLEPSELAFLSAECGLKDAAGSIDFGTLSRARPSDSKTCYTESYASGPGLPALRREFRIVAESVDGSAIRVEADPEIVLDRDGTVLTPPRSLPSPPRGPANPER
jgi:hypothetical protein